MQSAHQSFLTLGLGAAIILGVADTSSAQVHRPDYRESSISSWIPSVADSTTAPVLTTQAVANSEFLTFDVVPFDSYAVEFSQKTAETALGDNGTVSVSLEHPLFHSVSTEQGDDTAPLPEAYRQLVSQTPTVSGETDGETAVDAADGPSLDENELLVPSVEGDRVDQNETEPSVDQLESPADSVEPSVEQLDSPADNTEPSVDQLESPVDSPDTNAEPTAEDPDPDTDTDIGEDTVAPLPGTTDAVIDLDSPTEESVTEDETEIDETPEIEVEVEIEVDGDISEEDIPEIEVEIELLDTDLDLDDDPVEIPDYLLSPPNSLFVPINPETVEIVGTQPLSLEQALEIARRNSRELQSAIQTLEQSQEALREQRAAFLPTITATSQLEHSDTDISFESGLGNLDGQPTVDTNLSLNVTVNYDIFTSGFRSASVRAAENNVRLQELQVEVVQETLSLSITNAYYNLQEGDEFVRIAEDTVEQSRLSLSDALARERAGVGTRFDRLQAEVQLANDEQNLVNALRDQSVSRRELAELLSLPPGIDVSAADPVEVAGSWALPLENTLLLAYRNRAELEQELVERELNQQQARANIANRWPQLSAFASYDMNDLLDNTRVAQDLEELSVGLQLSWTLYNGGATRAAARQEAIAAEIDETEFADTREAIRQDVEEEYLNLGANFKNIQTANSAVGLAEESLRLARLRFGAGVGIQSDVLEAQTQLSEAQGNLVSAILDYNRALIAIQRAVSNWPDNNLSADPIREPQTLSD